MTTASNNTPAPGRPRSTKADAKILEAGLALFLDSGITGIGYEQIARASGVTRATIYRRYPQRQDLLFAIIAEGHRRLTPAEGQVPLHPGLDDLVRTWAQALSDPDGRRLQIRLIGLFANDQELYREFQASSVAARNAAIDAVLDSARTAGEFAPEADLDMVRTLLVASVSAHLLNHPDTTDVDEIADYLRRCLRTLGAEGS